MPVFYRRSSEDSWALIGHVPADNVLAWRPSSAQTGEVLGAVRDDALWILDYTVFGLHWPDSWGRNFRPTVA